MLKKTNRGSVGYDYWNRIINGDIRGGGRIRNRIKHNYKSIKNFTRRICKKHNKSFKGLLGDTRGFMSTIEFIFLFTIIIFVLFGGVDYYLTEVQHNIVEETTNFYLSKMKFTGTLHDNDRQSIIAELSDKGFKNITVSATDGYGNELSSNTIIVRNVEDLTASVLFIEVKAEPFTKPFMFGRLLGSKEEDNFYFKVDRRSMSERPTY